MSLTREFSALGAASALGCGVVVTFFLQPVSSQAQTPPDVGRPILFVHGICDDASGWDGSSSLQGLARQVISGSSAASSPLYPDLAIHKVYYDGLSVKQWPGGEDFLSTTLPTARLF